MTTMKNPYRPEDVGCYRVYTVDRIVQIARAHGAVIACEEDDDAAEREATAFMNEHYPVDGCSWAWNQNGDWGLWPVDDV